MYVNEHHNCLMDQQKTENTKLKQQLIDCNIKLNHQPIKTLETLDLEDKINSLERSLNIEKELVSKLQKDLEQSNKKYQELSKLLQESHEQTSKHLTHANKHQNEAKQLRDQYEEARENLANLRSEFKKMEKELTEGKNRHEVELADWSEKEKDLNKEVSTLKETLTDKESAMLQLEEVNSQWAKKNIDLTIALETAEARLNVEKFNKEIQIGSCYSSLQSDGSQTMVSDKHMASQTDRTQTRATTTQCIVPAFANICTQTQNLQSPTNQNTQTDPIGEQKQPIRESLTSTANISTQFDSIRVMSISTQTHSQNDIQATQFGSGLASLLQNEAADDLSNCSFPRKRSSFQLTPIQASNDKENSQKTWEIMEGMEKRKVWGTGAAVINRQGNRDSNASSEKTLNSKGLDDNNVNSFSDVQHPSLQKSPSSISDDNVQNSFNQDSSRFPSPSNTSKRGMTRLNLPCSSSPVDNKPDMSLHPLPKYPRLTYLGRSTPKTVSSPYGRKSGTPSPFPSMGVKAVNSRKDNFFGGPILADFSGSEDLGQSPELSNASTRRGSLLKSQQASSNLQSTKGILKGALNFKTKSNRKSVQFIEGHEEQEFTVISPELSSSNETRDDFENSADYDFHVSRTDSFPTPNQKQNQNPSYSTPVSSSKTKLSEDEVEVEEFMDHVKQVHQALNSFNENYDF